MAVCIYRMMTSYPIYELNVYMDFKAEKKSLIPRTTKYFRIRKRNGIVFCHHIFHVLTYLII